MEYEYRNKDISWLSFNQRVLEEAANCSLSVSERLRFLAYFSNNLDEFYHFKVYKYLKKDLTIAEQIKAIVSRQQEDYYKLLSQSIFKDLHSEGVSFLKSNELTDGNRIFVRRYFKENVLANIQLVMLRNSVLKNFHLSDNTIYLSVCYSKSSSSKKKYAIVGIPPEKISRFIKLDSNLFMFVEDVIKCNMDLILPAYELDSVFSFKVLRHFKIKYKGEEDIKDIVKHGMEKRNKAAITVFIHDKDMSIEHRNELSHRLNISENLFLASSSYIKFSDFFSFIDKYLPFESDCGSVTHPVISKYGSVIKAARRTDILLHYPYHSFDYFIKFLQEAVVDKKIKEITITWYRVARKSVISNLLIMAVRNNKRVRVVMELKAKMEEVKNLAFAKKMEDNGISVIYTNTDIKVHAKMLLLKRINKKGEKSYISYLSTGNFNEKSAESYTDHALITSSVDVCNEVNVLFGEIIDNEFKYQFKHLLVSPINLKRGILEKIQREIRFAKQGKEASLRFKMNGLQDIDVINKLYEASLTGVKIELLVRGMSCLVPNMEYSRNIHLVRLVDKYLEHGRIYYFHNDGNPEIYMGSADLMTKKLDKRVESIFPVYDKELRSEIICILDILFSDNTNTEKKESVLQSGKQIRAQKEIYNYLSSLTNTLK